MSMVCTVSAGHKMSALGVATEGRELWEKNDDLSNLRESSGDVLKLQRHPEFAGNC